MLYNIGKSCKPGAGVVQLLATSSGQIIAMNLTSISNASGQKKVFATNLPLGQKILYITILN